MKSEEKNIQVKKGGDSVPFDIPVEGSLGLLALGAVGIVEWRKVRNAHKKKMNTEGDDK